MIITNENTKVLSKIAATSVEGYAVDAEQTHDPLFSYYIDQPLLDKIKNSRITKTGIKSGDWVQQDINQLMKQEILRNNEKIGSVTAARNLKYEKIEITYDVENSIICLNKPSYDGAFRYVTGQGKVLYFEAADGSCINVDFPPEVKSAKSGTSFSTNISWVGIDYIKNFTGTPICIKAALIIPSGIEGDLIVHFDENCTSEYKPLFIKDSINNSFVESNYNTCPQLLYLCAGKEYTLNSTEADGKNIYWRFVEKGVSTINPTSFQIISEKSTEDLYDGAWLKSESLTVRPMVAGKTQIIVKSNIEQDVSVIDVIIYEDFTYISCNIPHITLSSYTVNANIGTSIFAFCEDGYKFDKTVFCSKLVNGGIVSTEYLYNDTVCKITILDPKSFYQLTGLTSVIKDTSSSEIISIGCEVPHVRLSNYSLNKNNYKELGRYSFYAYCDENYKFNKNTFVKQDISNGVCSVEYSNEDTVCKVTVKSLNDFVCTGSVLLIENTDEPVVNHTVTLNLSNVSDINISNERTSQTPKTKTLTYTVASNSTLTVPLYKYSNTSDFNYAIDGNPTGGPNHAPNVIVNDSNFYYEEVEGVLVLHITSIWGDCTFDISANYVDDSTIPSQPTDEDDNPVTTPTLQVSPSQITLSYDDFKPRVITVTSNSNFTIK